MESRSAGRYGRWIGRVAAMLIMAGAVQAQTFNSGSDGSDGAFQVLGIGSMSPGRHQHRETLLPNGKVLLSGGYAGGNSSMNDAYVFDPTTRQFSGTGNMNSARYAHTMTLLPNGKILVAGGNRGTSYTNTVDLYDPATGVFTTAGSMLANRGYHAATLLPDGKVLMTGSADGGTLASAERYDPATGQFTATGVMSSRRHAHTATLLPNGKVLVAGGHNGSSYISSAELYDPSTGVFTPTGTMTASRGYHSATLLPSGKVLVIGGYAPNGLALTTAEIYEPDTGRFVATTTNMSVARAQHRAILLQNGKVLVSGGSNGGSSLTTAELYSPATDAFQLQGAMTAARYEHTATLLPSGQVLVIGGFNGNNYIASADIYDPTTELFSTFVFDPRAVSPPLDPQGDNVFHFTTVTIPSGVIVRLSSKFLSGPVHWLASGPVTIDGTIDLSGRSGHPTTNNAQFRVAAEAGAGGFAGGVGGNTTPSPAQPGSGPLGGARAPSGAGSGGGFSGNEFLTPLVGGSAGAGYDRPASEARFGAGGGGGAGALLIASSASITVRGAIRADGGAGVDGNCGSGGGAGGGIRLVAPVINGSGTLSVNNGAMGTCSGVTGSASGRVRLESFLNNFTGSIVGTTNISRGSPLATFVPTAPASVVRVVRIAGHPVPTSPTGSFELPDVAIDESAATLVEIEANYVPVGTVVKLHLFSLEAADQVVSSGPLGGTLEASSATATVTFPPGFTRGFARAVWR